MAGGGITLLGLGPGDPQLLTQQARQILEACQEIFVRTRLHPVVDTLSPRIEIHAFDDNFIIHNAPQPALAALVEQVLTLGERPAGVIYAVPGHPLVDDAAGAEIARRARIQGQPLRVVAGVSILDAVLSALQVDLRSQFTLIDALELTGGHAPPFPTSAPAIITRVDTPAAALGVQHNLLALYPGVQVVTFVHKPGTANQHIETLALGEIDQSDRIAPGSCLYLPPLGTATSFEAFVELIAHLRAPDGCPWDREQTHQSLRTHLLEETYEVLAALDANDPQAMREEFGDLLLQVVLHAQIASESGTFNMAGILEQIHTKIIRRHPHVFGDLEMNDAQGVLRNWERLKAEERAANGKSEASLLDGLASALPALLQAEQYQRRAARVGFDWPEIQGVLDKLAEELAEVHAAQDDAQRFFEVGDLLFAVVNLSRWLQVEPESALRESNARFRKRFSFIERTARQQGRNVEQLSLDEMETLWQAAKNLP